jgi:hypothetical protein
MKRPLLWAFLCWFLLFLFPLTRRGIFKSWENHQHLLTGLSRKVDAAPFVNVTPETAEIVRQFSNNKSVRVSAAKEYGSNDHNLQVLAKLYPDDPLVIRLQIEGKLKGLTSARSPGPVTMYPLAQVKRTIPNASPPSAWEPMIQLARRGHQLEPQNTYFDWMLLYALYASNQDVEARRTLQKAAKKTKYTDYTSDLITHSINFSKLSQGEPVTPVYLLAREAAEAIGPTCGRIRQVARWAMDDVVIEWQEGRRHEAIDLAISGATLSRTMGHNSYSVIENLTARACQGIFLTIPAKVLGQEALTPLPRTRARLDVWQQYPGSLYSMALSQGRKDVLPLLNKAWVERAETSRKITSPAVERMQVQSVSRAAWISAAARLRAIIIHSLPSLLVVGIAFSLLSFKVQSPDQISSAIWKGMWLGLVLFAMVMICDASLVFRKEGFAGNWRLNYILPSGLLFNTVSWTLWGIVTVAVCYGFHLAVRWQKSHLGNQKPFLFRIKNIFNPPEDGLDRLDFGWFFVWIARISVWLLFAGILVTMIGDHGDRFSNFLWVIPTVLMAYSLAAHLIAWSRLPERTKALRLTVNFAFESVVGCFLMATLLYTVFSLAILPQEFRHQMEFEERVQLGEMKRLQSTLGS